MWSTVSVIWKRVQLSTYSVLVVSVNLSTWHNLESPESSFIWAIPQSRLACGPICGWVTEEDSSHCGWSLRSNKEHPPWLCCASLTMSEFPGQRHWPVEPQACLYASALTEFLLWFPSVMTCELQVGAKRTFPSPTRFSPCVFHSDRNQARTLTSHYTHIKASQRNNWKLLWK